MAADPQPAPRRELLYFIAATGVLGLVALLVLDRPLAVWLHQHEGLRPFFSTLTTGVDTVFEALFYFGNLGNLPAGYVILFLVFLLGRFWLHSPNAGVFLLVLLTRVNSEVAVNLLKIYFRRPRPNVFLLHGMTGTGFWQSAGFWQTATLDFSFPSSHAAIYLSMFLPVAWFYPKYRWPLLVLPLLIGAGRMVLELHFLSDVLFAWFIVGIIMLLFSRLPFITPRPPFQLRRLRSATSGLRGSSDSGKEN
ncbi:phosphatase PAP2 family protein [Hymenobacter sp. BT491]|uniref:phosphatase PAP2 family protein n=1 Tax=Hymenobacter sp. BT491 TaxID=2766779 RepID=UPI0016535E9F|nr:phosphatase PAP2 family protein [Hymenobacter sp. BT491]MBC6988462.1 phosphatase PAP2 family protein [Hymenobacter sp. BT491]